MLKIIYGSILRLYTYSDIDAHKSKRAHHWLTKRAPMWKHQDLLAAKDKKPLSLFPGVAVGPAGTSQMCSWCQKNPLTIIDTLKENKTKSPFSANNDGILKLAMMTMPPKFISTIIRIKSKKIKVGNTGKIRSLLHGIL